MGTRHLICVYVDGEYKVAQYGQWDGYPSGQGIDILKFLQTTNLEIFKEKVRKMRWYTDVEMQEITDNHTDNGSITMGSLQDIYWKTHLQHISRDTGAKILTMILLDKAPALRSNIKFAQDSLFCEYAYVIDFDEETFEVYEGFNKEPLSENERFYTGEVVEKYHPVRFKKSYSIWDLPSEELFLKTLEPDDEDE